MPDSGILSSATAFVSSSFDTALLSWALALIAGGIVGGGLGWWIAAHVPKKDRLARSEPGTSLRSPEAHLHSALSVARAGTFELDVRSLRITSSAGLRRLFGFADTDSLHLRDYLDRIHPGDRDRVAALIHQSIEKGAGHFAEYRVMLEAGQERWVGARADLVCDADGKVERLAGTLIDITERRQTEEALLESEQRFRSLFEHNIDGIFSVDLEGRFQNANPAALRISGYSLAELRERRFSDLCAPDMLEITETVFRSTLSGTSQQIETAMIRPDGIRVELLIRSTPTIVNDKIVGIFGVAEDITERKRTQRALDENERRLQLALEAGQMGLWTWNLEENAVTLDAANCQLFGIDVPGGAFPSEDLFQKIQPDDRGVVHRKINTMLSGDGDYAAEFRVLLPEGRVRWLAGRGRVVRDNSGKAIQIVGVNFDVTQHQVATEQLNLAKVAAEAASRAKDDFIAALSHELRTPLSPVLILASDQERNSALPPELRADFGLIRKNVEMEAQLIDDLLDLTRITRGKLRLELRPLDLCALCHDAVEMLRAEISVKRLNLSVECTASRHWVEGDTVRLQQVFWNLLKNAVKFTPVGGRVRVEICDGKESLVLVRVQDTGIGIDPENLERIFDAFEQGDVAINRCFGGLGLGLAISRTLVEMHGGRLWAISEGRDLGTSFHLELPVTNAADTQPTAPTPPDQSLTPRRILLVEDDEATRTTLERLLSRRGHQVTAFATLAPAAEAARKERFDFLISDLGLPDGSGHELMAQLRDIPDLQGIALSGYGMEDDVARSRESGFAVHLTKPIDIKVLDRTLAQLSTTLPRNVPGTC